MENITALFEDVYLPYSGIILYKNRQDDGDCYVESFDVDEDGNPVNLHPLSESEAASLAKALDSSPSLQKSFLKPKGLLPDTVLYIDPSQQGSVIWQSPAQKANLLFVPELGIPSGKAFVPALIWKATKQELYVYALKSDGKPDLNTVLYHAPFFNLYSDGKVCMGTVDVQIAEAMSLEDFMAAWQRYFFQSYFSHLIDCHNPVKGNIVQLWQKQMTAGSTFPVNFLKKSKHTLKSLIR